MKEMCFITAKGGQGCSTTAAAIALGAPVETDASRVLLVDWHDDLPAVLGMANPSELNYGPVPVNEHLDLASSAWWLEYDMFDTPWDVVIHDIGVVDGSRALPGDVFLVTRPCYLAMRRFVILDISNEVNGVILINEPGRALGRRDIENATQTPVVCELPFDPHVSRMVDAGLLVSRLPKSMQELRDLGAQIA